MNTPPAGRLGLSGVEADVATAFLALELKQLPLVGLVGNPQVLPLISLLSAFENLCNLNVRDRQASAEILAQLSTDDMEDQFPHVVRALILWSAGGLESAREALVSHIKDFDMDFIALFMLHMFDFLDGRPDRYLVDSTDIEAERCEHLEFGRFYKGLSAFSHCEQGKAASAMGLALDAVNHPTPDAYSIHALVHCFHEQGELPSAIGALELLAPRWTQNGGMNMHVAWHVAVSQLMVGNVDAAIESYDLLQTFRVTDHAEQDLDAVNFCFRLFAMTGLHPGFEREHERLARSWAPSIYNSLSYFNDVHAALAFLLSGDIVSLRKLVERPNHSHLSSTHQKVGSNILMSILDLANNDHETAINRLADSEDQWSLIGGSRAQREVLGDLLRCARKGIRVSGQPLPTHGVIR